MSVLPTSPFMRDYNAMMDRLITEEPKDRRHKIQELYARVVRHVEMIGDEFFIERMQDCLLSLCNIKPGRTLIRAWLRLSEEKQVPLVLAEGQRTEYGDRSENPKEIVYVSKADLLSDTVYSTFKSEEPSYTEITRQGICYRLYQEGKLVKKPLFITLGHEILHMIHDLKERHIHIADDHDETFCLKGMTNREENHTIIGVNLKLYLLAKQKGISLNKEDFLCETALLLAARLPARISHGFLKRSEQTATDVSVSEEEFEGYKREFYEWLNKNLFELTENYHNWGEELRSVIPQECLESETFLLKAVQENPSLIAFTDQKKYKEVVITAFRARSILIDFKLLVDLVSEDLKSDPEFMKTLLAYR